MPNVLDQRSYSSKVIAWTHERATDTHTGPIVLYLTISEMVGKCSSAKTCYERKHDLSLTCRYIKS